jgi:NADP-dependent 3-hydroxy acid dehydrogenase YdfG
MTDRADRVAIVTGASSGLGRATAVRLAADGYRVALVARGAEALNEVADHIVGAGGHARAVPTDLADAAATHDAVRVTADAWGRVDAVVNAAATDAPGPVTATDDAAWNRVLAVNLTAPFVLARAAFPLMLARGGGTIVNVSSVAGRRGWANAAACCSTKFALTGLTQALAAEGRPHHIRACVLYPGAMATSWGVWTPEERESQDRPASLPEDALPAGDVAELIAWLVNSPSHLVLNEVTITPLHEQGWP